MPPSIAWALSIIKVFLLSSHLPPVWGVILAKVIFQEKFIRLKRGLQMIYLSLVKGLSRMTFLHLKCMHLGSVSLAFMRVCKVIFHYSCNQNSALESLHGVCFFFFWVFSRCMATFLRNHLNFQNSFFLDKHQHDFSFCTKLWIPKNTCEHVRSCIVLEEKGNTPKDSWCDGFMLNG